MDELPPTCSRNSGAGPRGDASQCPVCREPFADDSATVVHADCGSAVCSDCFFSWLRTSRTCAVCRGNIREASAEELRVRRRGVQTANMIKQDVRDMRTVADRLIGEERIGNTNLPHLAWQRRELGRHILPALRQRSQVRMARLDQQYADTIAATREKASRELESPIRDRSQAEEEAAEQRARNTATRQADLMVELAEIYHAFYLTPEILSILAEPDDGTHDLPAPPA